MAKKIKIGRHAFTAIQLVSTIAGVAIVVGTIGGVWIFQRMTAIAKARDWTAVGAPCPTLSRAAFLASGMPMAHVMVYDDVRFGRGYGYVNCNEIAAHDGRGPGIVSVCQFNNPSVLQVTTRRGDFFYATQTSPATVSITDGAPKCVLAVTMTLG